MSIFIDSCFSAVPLGFTTAAMCFKGWNAKTYFIKQQHIPITVERGDILNDTLFSFLIGLMTVMTSSLEQIAIYSPFAVHWTLSIPDLQNQHKIWLIWTYLCILIVLRVIMSLLSMIVTNESLEPTARLWCFRSIEMLVNSHMEHWKLFTNANSLDSRRKMISTQPTPSRMLYDQQKEFALTWIQIEFITIQ